MSDTPKIIRAKAKPNNGLEAVSKTEEMVDIMNYLPVEKEEIETERELDGDENIHSFYLEDGTFNEKYYNKVKDFPLTSSDELDEIKKIPFIKLNGVFKKDIILKLVFGIFSTVLGIVLFATDNCEISFLGLTLFISFMLLFSAGRRYFIATSGNVIDFAGIIVDVVPVGFFKATQYMVVKISNGKKFLNVKFNYDKHITKGLPLTLYISKNEPIVSSPYGPLVENIVGYVFDVDETKTTTVAENDEITASDYIK